LQNVKVIAYGRQLDPGAKVDPRDTSRPTVATLLVTQEQAEKLVLAGQRGRIQLALRNSLDDEITASSDPVKSIDLGIDEPRKPASSSFVPVRPAVSPPAPVVTTKTGKPETEGRVVRIFRGEKVTEETLK
ncbi:MAG: hypothetical protein DMG11_27230, partial [Acidobacteria bacterium]